MRDSLGDRMKKDYEERTRFLLPRRTYTMIRIDGKAFHTYTKGLKRPFDDELINDMDATAAYLCKNISGAKFAYVQSDEITIVVTDFEEIGTQAWFDNNLQKMCSVSASMATAKFNQLRLSKIADKLNNNVCLNDIKQYIEKFKLAEFDSRIWQIGQKTEVMNCLIWRQQDCVRNSISSLAQSLYSSKELHKKNTSDMQDMCWQKGQNWNDLAPKYKRGRVILKENYEAPNGGIRSRWVSTEPPTFTQDKEYLNNLIPNNI